jgi:hypothetical protein
VESPVIDELLADARLWRGAAPLRDVPDLPPHRDRLAPKVVPGDGGVTCARRKERCEHPQCGRLAGPVGTKEPGDLAGANVDVDAADGLDAARTGREPLSQPPRLNHVVNFEHACVVKHE